MLEFKGLSTEAKIGKILILVSIIMDIVIVISISTFSPIHRMMMVVPFFFSGLFLIIGAVSLLGLIVGIYALKATKEKEFHRAGGLAIISCLLPPLDIIMLIGGILCLISKEGKK